MVMCITFIRFYKACQVQGFDRNKLPYIGWFQPYSAWIGLAWMTFIVFCYGYSSFKPWDLKSFWWNYTMVILAPILFGFWKVVKKTRFVRASEIDLVWEAPIVDSYEATFIERPLGFWEEMLMLVGLRSRNRGGDRRQPSVVEGAIIDDSQTPIEPFWKRLRWRNQS